VTEDIFSRCLSLPIYAAMSADDVSYVIDAVRDLIRASRR
jgi:dTDP-4-amino-4,6-dideoxygalactose transaminase